MSMKNKIAIVGHGLVPSIVAERLLEKTSVEADKIMEQGNRTYMLENITDVYDRSFMYDKPTKKQMNQLVVPIRTEPKYQNNEPCPCGSGNKYKKCCKKL